MKKRQTVIALASCILAPYVLTAADSTTNETLATVANALRPIVERLDPKPTVEYPQSTESLEVAYLPQTFKIHRRSKTGEVSTNVFDEVGPSWKGFVLRVYVQPKGEVNQAKTPQTIREPYWLTDLDVTAIGATGKQIYWALSCGGRTPTNVLAELRTVLKQLDKNPHGKANE